MKLHKLLRPALTFGAACSFCLSGQSGNMVVGAGYESPAPVPVAPGQIVTLLVQGIGANLVQSVHADHIPLPTTLAGISVEMRQIFTASSAPAPPVPVPLLEVNPRIRTCLFNSLLPPCTRPLTAVTVQIPFELVPNVPIFNQSGNEAALVVSEGGVAGDAFVIGPFFDRIHIITNCLYSAPEDVFLPFSALCGQMVTHSDGSRVTAANPAKAGEVLVMYAFGLGATVPSVKTGEAAPVPAPVVAKPVLIGFDFRTNAAPQRVEQATPDQPSLLFAGLTPGFVGLYQLNFRVPPVPAGLPPCDVPAGPARVLNVRSNLTVSISSSFSFDGAPICVAQSN